MFEWVRRLFAPPFSKNEEQARITGLLHYILIVTIALNILNVILLEITTPNVSHQFWIDGVILILQFGLLGLLRRGYSVLASWLLCVAFWLAITVSVLTSGGLLSSSFGSYAVVILMAGILLGGRAAVGFALSSIGIGFYLYLSASSVNQKLASPVIPPTIENILTNNTVIFVTLAILLALAARSIDTALRRARNSENAVTEQNVLLQAEIAERRRAEEALRSNEEAARAFQERLKVFNEVTLELSNAITFDDLCRQAVELGRQKLNFDRLGLWFLEGDHTILGSFGTDEQGNTRDERGIRSFSDNEQLIKKAVEDKQLRAYSTDYPLYNHRREVVGHGWNVVSVLWDGDHVIGYLSVDNLLNLRPLTDTDLEILTLYGSTLGHLCRRKRAEMALTASEDAALQFQERLKIFNELTLTLSRAVTFDDLCQQAVELGREKLRFDRLGLWFLEDEQTIIGSFGTDEQGNTRDERGIRSWFDKQYLIKQSITAKEPLAYTTDIPLGNHQGEIVGRGWNVIAVLWDGDHVIGYLSVDNLLNQRPLTDADLEILTLYSSALGHLCRRKRAEMALSASEDAALQFQERLKILNEVNIELTKAETFDDLCRSAVELGCSRLGFDRLGLWFWSADGSIITGSFGIDEQGNIRDERNHKRPFMSDDLSIRSAQEPITIALGEDVVLRNDTGAVVGKGWNAITALWDSDRAIGWLAADNLLRQHPLVKTDLEILKLYGLALGNLCSRKRTAVALEASEEAARAFQERLKALYEVSLDLARVPTFDDLCRAAVELGRSKLGFDRLGIWLLDLADPDYMMGSFGTDEFGNTRDERNARLATSAQDKQVFQSMSERASRLFLEEAPIYNEQSHVVGVGQKAMAMLSDGHMVIGTISTDNLLQHRPITAQDLEVLVLYGSTLGYLYSRKRAEESLLKERNLLRTIIDIIPDRIYVKDKESRLVLVNKASWINTDGADSEQDLIGLTDSDFIAAEVADKIYASERVLFATGIPIINLEEPVRNEADKLIHFLTTKAPLFDNQGKMIGLVGVSRDVTDQKQAEQQRLELALQKERVDLLTEFIGNISHDLKTPLSVIKTSLYLLERLSDPERQEAKIQVIKEQTLRLEKLIQDVITMSRLEHGVLPVFEPVDFNSVIRDVAAKLNPTAERKQITVSLELENNLPLLLANENELWRLMANLVENALHYTPDAGTVTILSRQQDNQVVVEVSDTGIGIGAQDLPFIFDRFYRADPARSLERGGTGLGLAIVQRIIELHQGKIEVESVEGEGSKFRVIFGIMDTISPHP